MLLGLLRSQGVLTSQEPSQPCSESEALLAAFRGYLFDERALAPSTVEAYVLRARRFLDSRDPGVAFAESTAAESTAADISRAVLGEAGTGSVGSTQFFVVALLAFVRFSFVQGLVPVDLSAAALTATGRRRPGLPKGRSAGRRRRLCWIPVTGERPLDAATTRCCCSCFGWACARRSRRVEARRVGLARRRDRGARQGSAQRPATTAYRCR